MGSLPGALDCSWLDMQPAYMAHAQSTQVGADDVNLCMGYIYFWWAGNRVTNGPKARLGQNHCGALAACLSAFEALLHVYVCGLQGGACCPVARVVQSHLSIYLRGQLICSSSCSPASRSARTLNARRRSKCICHYLLLDAWPWRAACWHFCNALLQSSTGRP